MALLIDAKNIHWEYAGRAILKIDGLQLFDGDRIGLVGENGAGKSTLLKILLGELKPENCQISRLGDFTYIPQLAEPNLQGEKNYALLGRLKVGGVEIDHMSGGEETRLKIAQAFSESHRGILADEPGCHLDQEGIDFLIDRFKHFPGALVIVSHNRYLLDQVVEKIWELRQGRIKEYGGNYSAYSAQKEAEGQGQAVQYQQFLVEKKRLARSSQRKRDLAKKMASKKKGRSKPDRTNSPGRFQSRPLESKQKRLHKAVKSLDKRIAALGDLKPPERVRRVRFRQNKALELHNPLPIIGREINKCFGDKVLLEQASLRIPLGAKVALIGGNGVGKTTLIEMIFKREEGFIISPKAAMGYFAQDSYKYDGRQTILTFMAENCQYKEREIRSVLAALGFRQEALGKKLAVLSGGEIVKLFLAKMLLGNYNILLMDEPSSFLDLPGIEGLEMLMKDYIGTILFASHDSNLVANVADLVYEIKNKKINLIRQRR